jgi:hypothetical protein
MLIDKGKDAATNTNEDRTNLDGLYLVAQDDDKDDDTMLMIRKQHNIRIKKTGVSSYD